MTLEPGDRLLVGDQVSLVINRKLYGHQFLSGDDEFDPLEPLTREFNHEMFAESNRELSEAPESKSTTKHIPDTVEYVLHEEVQVNDAWLPDVPDKTRHKRANASNCQLRLVVPVANSDSVIQYWNGDRCVELLAEEVVILPRATRGATT